MRSTEFIAEYTEQDHSIIDGWTSGWKQDARTIKKLSDFNNYQKPTSNNIYRMWTISPTAAAKLFNKHKPWEKNKPPAKPIVLKPKRKVISFSWSKQGAINVTDDGYEHRGVQILVKKKLLPNTLFFNLYQWGVKNPKFADAKLIKSEKEALIVSNDYYLTIDKSEIVNLKQAMKQVDDWVWG